MDERLIKGHVEAIVTIIIWGTTFVSTKVLLDTYSPIEILLLRFMLGYAALWIASPHILRFHSWKEERLFIAAGFTGVFLYYLVENIALIYTNASNVGVIIAVSPFFVALFSKKALSLRFFVGFALSIFGISLISFSGHDLSFNLLGDLLALTAAIVWATYSILTEKIASLGYNVLQSTRRIFMYGLIFMIPLAIIMGFSVNPSSFAMPLNVLNIVYLGLGASALCFVTWNSSVSILGPVSTSVYLYLTPVVTVVASALILSERMDAVSVCGTLLTLLGLIFSQWRRKVTSS